MNALLSMVLGGKSSMRNVHVRFDSGREVLGAYWGFLSNGGLLIPHHGDLELGEHVALQVHVQSTQSDFSLAGRVVNCESNGYTAVAFSEGEPHDMLLSDALAETEDLPPREHHRHPFDREATLSEADHHEDTLVRLVNVSESGCCLEVDHSHTAEFAVGTQVNVRMGDFDAPGEIVWTANTERGVRFSDDTAPAVRRLVKEEN